MKWMGWSWADYCTAPGEHVVEILALIQEENDRMEQMG